MIDNNIDSMNERYLLDEKDWRVEHWELKRFLNYNSTFFYIHLRDRTSSYCDDFCFFVFDGAKLHCVNVLLTKIFSDFLRGTKKKRWLYGIGTSANYKLSVLRISHVVKLKDKKYIRILNRDLNPLFSLVFKDIQLVEFYK